MITRYFYPGNEYTIHHKHTSHIIVESKGVA